VSTVALQEFRICYNLAMPTKKPKQATKGFHYKFGSVGALLIILGILFNNGAFFIFGFISSLIWAYKYQKINRKFHWVWAIIVILLLLPFILLIAKDVNKFM